MNKLRLNDSAFTFEPETSDALGFGFRCGYLGLLHMEIVQERLERESGLDIVQTAPTVPYEIAMQNQEIATIHSPGDLPESNLYEEIREPVVTTHLLIPAEAIGDEAPF